MNGAPNVVQFGGGERRICCWAFMVSVKNFRLTTLVGNHNGADLEIPDVYEHVIAVNQAPFIPARRRIQVILAIIYLVAAIPVFVLDLLALLPFMVLHVVMVIAVVVVLVLRVCRSTRKACRQYS